MGKKRAAIIGSPDEDLLKAKHAVKLEQKKLREGRTGTQVKTAKAPGLAGGQRVSDSTQESLREYEELQKRQAALTSSSSNPALAKTVAPKIRSKAYVSAKAQVDSTKVYPLSQAIELLRKVSYSKSNDTVELHLILKNKPSSELKVILPTPIGSPRKVAVFSDSVMAQIEAGKLDFDLLVASPSDMPKLVKFAKTLGPKGLMPNPKNGTVSSDPQAAAKKLAADVSSTLKLDKSGPVIHTSVGKLSFKDQQLSANIATILQATASSGFKKIVLKSSMSPAIRLQV
jgi:large subunit ribosomal protein L1